MIQNTNIKLSSKLISKLINEPETGIGYHRVDVIMESGIVYKSMIILHSSVLLTESSPDINGEEILDFIIHNR